MSGMITDVPGVLVGQWTGDRTGVTVVLLPPGTVGAAEVRGGAPATRELAALEPGRTVETVDAVVLTGGSAFGLSTADGVMTWLAARDRGVATPGGVVPIVPTAAIYDLVVSGGHPPGPVEAQAAIAAAGPDPPRTGRVGAGRGATVGKWMGPQHAVPGGLGSASARVGDAIVGALAVVNAIGDVVGADGRILAGSQAPPGAETFPDPAPGEPDLEPNTTLIVVATDAAATKSDCHLLAQSGHHGLAQAVHPSHTRHDGDLVIAVSTGSVAAHLDRLRVATTEVVAAAVRHAVVADDD